MTSYPRGLRPFVRGLTRSRIPREIAARPPGAPHLPFATRMAAVMIRITSLRATGVDVYITVRVAFTLSLRWARYVEVSVRAVFPGWTPKRRPLMAGVATSATSVRIHVPGWRRGRLELGWRRVEPNWACSNDWGKDDFAGRVSRVCWTIADVPIQIRIPRRKPQRILTRPPPRTRILGPHHGQVQPRQRIHAPCQRTPSSDQSNRVHLARSQRRCNRRDR